MARPPNNGSPLPPAGTGVLMPGQVLLGHLTPQAAIAGWESIRPFLADALAWGDGRETEASLYARILHGQNLLFTVVQAPSVIALAAQPRLAGVIVVELSLDGTTANIIALAFEKGGSEPSIFPAAINFLRELLAPVTWFECTSRRPGMERFLAAHGWREWREPAGLAFQQGFKRFVIGPPLPPDAEGHLGVGSRAPEGPNPEAPS